MSELPQFLRDASKYFENRPTNGEDKAHWANVYNAENCNKAADEIERLEKLVDELRSLLIRADKVMIWEDSPHLGRGFQDEVEAVLAKS